jgi:hypothetical protein
VMTTTCSSTRFWRPAISLSFVFQQMRVNVAPVGQFLW